MSVVSEKMARIPFTQRANCEKFVDSLKEEPNFSELKEVALECYKCCFANDKGVYPLVKYALGMQEAVLVRKFREIDEDSKKYPLNELIMFVARKNIQSSEIRDYLFSEASAEQLSELVWYPFNNKLGLHTTILHAAIENRDTNLIARLMKKKVDLHVVNDEGKTPRDLAELKFISLEDIEKENDEQNLFAASPFNKRLFE